MRIWFVILCGALLALSGHRSDAQLMPGEKTAIGLNIAVNEQSLVNFGDYLKIADAEGRDANGWPTSDFTLLIDNRYIFAWDRGNKNIDPLKYSTNIAGRYRFSFKGDAVVGGTTNSHYDKATNTTVADYEIEQAESGLLLRIPFLLTRRTPDSPQGSGVTNIRLVRVENEKAIPQVFTDIWLDSIRKYPWAVLRCMEALKMNDYGVAGSAEAYPHLLTWAERRLPGNGPLLENVSSGVHGVLSWEDLVILAQLTHKDLWINIPVNASDDYVDQLARLFKNGNAATGNTGIPADVKVYIEYSNEMWHLLFPQGKWNLEAAQDEVKAGGSNLNYDGSAGTPEQWRFRRIAKRTVEIGRQFRRVFNTDRVRPVMNCHLTARDFDMLHYVDVNYGKPANELYAISQQGYYTSADSSSPQKILEGEKTASDHNRAAYVRSRTLATYFGLHSLAYEGGPDETGPGDVPKDPAVFDPNLPNKLAAARDPGVKDVILHDLMDNWFTSGGEMYVAFEQVGRYSFWGTFGLTEDLTNLKTGKWAAHVAALETPVPPLHAGTMLPDAAGQSVEIPEPEKLYTPGPEPWAMILLRVPFDGQYSFVVHGKPQGPESAIRLMIDDSLAGTTTLPLDSVEAGPVLARLKPGLHSLFLFLDGKQRINVLPASRLTVTALEIQK